jgi:hypothetical protein
MKNVKVFVAFPSDMNKEASIVKIVIERLNILNKELNNIHLETIFGADAKPGMGIAEGVILEQYDLGKDFDIFIGIIWNTFGTPTGRINNKTGQKILSGIEEEFYFALNSYKISGSPDILFYRCIRPNSGSNIDPIQLKRVEKFFKEFESKGKFPGFVKKFKKQDDFENIIAHDLAYSVNKIIHEDSRKTSNIDLGESFQKQGYEKLFLAPENNKRNEEKQEAIKKSNFIKLIAFTGHSYISEQGHIFKDSLIKRLENNIDVQIIIMNQWSFVGLKVAEAELTSCHADEDIIGFIEKSSGFNYSYKPCISGFLELKKDFGNKIELKLSKHIITSSFLLTDKECFFEPYSYFNFQERKKKLFTCFEIKATSESLLYKDCEHLFESLWETAIPFHEFENTEQTHKEYLLKTENILKI